MGRRCEIHDLAVGSDGRCVRCRRADQLADRRVAAAARSRWPGWPLILSVLVTVGVLGYLFFGPKPSKKETVAPPPEKTAVAIKPDSRLLWEQLGDDQPSEPSAGGAGAGQVGSTAPQPPPAQPQHSVLPSSEQYSVAYLNLVRDAARKAPIHVYYTTWCPVCTRARKWLSDNQIPHTAYDVERTEGAKREMKRLNPAGSIPTFKVGDRVLGGYSSSVLCRAVLAEANKSK